MSPIIVQNVSELKRKDPGQSNDSFFSQFYFYFLYVVSWTYVFQLWTGAMFLYTVSKEFSWLSVPETWFGLFFLSIL